MEKETRRWYTLEYKQEAVRLVATGQKVAAPAKALGSGEHTLARVCRPYRPETMGKIESTVRFVKGNFWSGIEFDSLSELNRAALVWCGEVNGRVHATTREIPLARFPHEGLTPLNGQRAYDTSYVSHRQVAKDCLFSYRGGDRLGAGLPCARHDVAQPFARPGPDLSQRSRQPICQPWLHGPSRRAWSQGFHESQEQLLGQRLPGDVVRLAEGRATAWHGVQPPRKAKDATLDWLL